MTIDPRNLLGICIAISFILNAVGVFTPAWIVGTNTSIGIVPWCQHQESWFYVMSCFMYISFGLLITAVLFFVFAEIKIRRTGFSDAVKTIFILITVALGVSGILGLSSFIAFAANASDNCNSCWIGYSVWIVFASLAFTIVGFCTISVILRLKTFYNTPDDDAVVERPLE